MNVEFYNAVCHEEDYESIFPSLSKEMPQKQIYTFDIDENAPINEIFSKLHDITKIARFIEVEWDGNIEKVSYSYYFKNGSRIDDFRGVEDLERKIKDFPKHGSNGELSLYMETTIAYGN